MLTFFNGLLGCRVVVETLDELRTFDRLLKNSFEEVTRSENLDCPNEFGGRGIECLLRYHDGTNVYPVALQLRTFLQHYWASTSFHLFHKQRREVALQHKTSLLAFGESLHQAEQAAKVIQDNQPNPKLTQESGWSANPICSRVHLIVIEPGEQFAVHKSLLLCKDDETDHERIVAQKLELYETIPNSTIVECSCLNFLSFMFNEPQVCVSADRLDRIIL